MPASAHLPTAGARARTAPKFRIIAETADYLVVDKPPFLLIHPSKPDGTPTLWAVLRELLAFELANGGQVSIVNRLDRETSGLVLIAKNAGTARRFGLAMQARLVEKEYLAIVRGWPAWEITTVDAPLARQGAHGPSAIWLKQAIHEKGAPAVTQFRVEEQFVRRGDREGQFAVIRAIPRTGRTHQIRVHLAHLGHPIVGDKIYGLTRGFTFALSKQAGRMNWRLSSFCRGTRCIQRGSVSPANSIGKAGCRRTSRNGGNRN
jgi:23S rRNA pseudouridine1911/1915/1917 synthase